MKISRLASWIGPTYVGSIASSWGAVTTYILLAKPEPILGNPWLTWLVMVSIATPIASTLATTMLVLDVLLLRLKARTLPTGRTAWGMAFLAPLPVAIAFWHFWPNWSSGAAVFALSVAAPLLLSALAVRIGLGSAIEKS